MTICKHFGFFSIKKAIPVNREWLCIFNHIIPFSLSTKENHHAANDQRYNADIFHFCNILLRQKYELIFTSKVKLKVNSQF